MRQREIQLIARGSALAFLLAGVALAQSGPTVSDRVRDAMFAKEVAWKLAWSKSEGSEFDQLWTRGAEEIDITYLETASVAEATEWLNEVPASTAIAGHKPLPGVGDQAFIIAQVTESGSATINFRRGKSVVTLSGPSAPPRLALLS